MDDGSRNGSFVGNRLWNGLVLAMGVTIGSAVRLVAWILPSRVVSRAMDVLLD